MTAIRGLLAAAGMTALACTASVTPAEAVTRTEITVNGLKVYRFVWRDSKGLTRGVSLKKQGSGNPGNGGYAVQYYYRDANGNLVTANAPNGDGFGYFVGHERFRKFTDGDSAPIASKIFGVDDSPLGRGFPVTTRAPATGPNKKIMEFKLTYPKYGTIAANGIDQNTGEDSPPIGTAQNLFQRYDLPVTITWYFQDGRDHPRIVTKVDLTPVPGPNRVSFDVRGPYGKLDFDAGNKVMTQVLWGDRFQFRTTVSPLTRNSNWVYNVSNTANARYASLIASGGKEIGLVEPYKFVSSAINDGYSLARGKTSATYNNGNGCPFQNQKVPCDYEWPYQNANYELPYNNPNGTTTSEKFAWGSSPFYGMNIASTFDGTQAVPFDGFPARGFIRYHTCLVLGSVESGGTTRNTAIRGGNYNCADTTLN